MRHKALDCVGDLALAGARVRARVVACKPSHRGTVKLVRAMREALKKETTVLEIDDIMKVLPHRYPFLLVDRILEMEPRKRIVGIKNVTINEPFFQGHFPGHPIMPGVLIIEAMAQVGGMLLMGTVPDPQNKVVYFTSLDNVKWRRPVRPGDQLRFELEHGSDARHDVQDERRGQGGRRDRGARRRWAPWCATDERDASIQRRSSIAGAKLGRRRRDRPVGDRGRGLRHRRRLRARARARCSSGNVTLAPRVTVGIGSMLGGDAAGPQVQGRADAPSRSARTR